MTGPLSHHRFVVSFVAFCASCAAACGSGGASAGSQDTSHDAASSDDGSSGAGAGADSGDDGGSSGSPTGDGGPTGSGSKTDGGSAGAMSCSAAQVGTYGDFKGYRMFPADHPINTAIDTLPVSSHSTELAGELLVGPPVPADRSQHAVQCRGREHAARHRDAARLQLEAVPQPVAVPGQRGHRGRRRPLPRVRRRHLQALRGLQLRLGLRG